MLFRRFIGAWFSFLSIRSIRGSSRTGSGGSISGSSGSRRIRGAIYDGSDTRHHKVAEVSQIAKSAKIRGKLLKRQRSCLSKPRGDLLLLFAYTQFGIGIDRISNTVDLCLSIIIIN